MSSRKEFLKSLAAFAAVMSLSPQSSFAGEGNEFMSMRPALADRKFTSEAVEKMIAEFSKNVPDKRLAWLFGNCFPNTLDTTVDFEMIDGRPDTYVITGDIDAMWLRDSSAQVWPYLAVINKDPKLKLLIAGVINRQVKNILKDPYANAFYKDETKVGEWKSDLTDMQPGIHERKWEIDSLCYPVRLAYRYWKETGDVSPFDDSWLAAMKLILKTFREQQRKEGNGPYSFQRTTAWATDGVPLAGYGYPAKPNGMICSSFRPSDDATLFSYLIPSNFFAVVSLKQAAEMLRAIKDQGKLSNEFVQLAEEVKTALQKHGTSMHPVFGKIYAYEVDGFGSTHFMDDANVPSLLSLPYLNAVAADDEIYTRTRKFLLSSGNPFFFKGKAGEGIGGPHAGINMIWPLSISMRGLTSNDPNEIKKCINMLADSNAGTGFMHESFNKDDATKFSRKWFAWANTLFGEFLYHSYMKHPSALKS